jgi:DNA-binding MarR family transcriptional regulator
MDDDRIAAWRAVLLAQHRVVQAIERELADEGMIPLSWYDVLLELSASSDEGLRMQDLGERVVLSRSRVSRLVDELERRGLVERCADPTDGRATLACLTADGRTEFRRAARVYLRGIEEYFSRHLTEDERRVIAGGLARVIEQAPTN